MACSKTPCWCPRAQCWADARPKYKKKSGCFRIHAYAGRPQQPHLSKSTGKSLDGDPGRNTCARSVLGMLILRSTSAGHHIARCDVRTKATMCSYSFRSSPFIGVILSLFEMRARSRASAMADCRARKVLLPTTGCLPWSCMKATERSPSQSDRCLSTLPITA